MAPAMLLGSEIQPEAKGNSNDNAYAINHFVISAVTCTVLPHVLRGPKSVSDLHSL
mgnify:CR=1 FL=1